jgi:hypothetical protein
MADAVLTRLESELKLFLSTPCDVFLFKAIYVFLSYFNKLKNLDNKLYLFTFFRMFVAMQQYFALHMNLLKKANFVTKVD